MQLLVFVCVLAFLALVAQAKRPTYHELDNYNFEKYIVDFGLDVQPGSSDYVIRKSIFDAELSRVKTHNAKNLSWKEGINKFSAMTVGEKQAYFGHSKGAAQNHKPKHSKEANLHEFATPVSELSYEVDWRKTGIVSAVKDQGYCGSCWAFCSTAVIESHVAKETGLLFDLSVQQIAMCTPNPQQCGGTGGCEGATSALAMDYVAGSKGLFEEYQYPYSSYYGKNFDCLNPNTKPHATIGGFVQLPSNNYTAVMNAISKVGPLAIAVDASAWSAYESGIFDGCNQANPDIDHGVVLVGYGEEDGKKYWLVRNSWAPSWGEKGYIRVARTDNEDQRCGSDITPQDGIACAGQNEPVEVCGTCGILFDVVYPTGAKLV